MRRYSSVFYISHDDRFIIKTMRKHEMVTLRNMLVGTFSFLGLRLPFYSLDGFCMPCHSLGGHKPTTSSATI